ncbi:MULTISPECIES: DUF4232 domain-containing protein [unclassified Micromonospora]|uniref:DUF4232 domain-containing protein n=1 Tax=unclassified Micromonospora TaxID=2617518 RepID=UPI0033225EF7
MATPAHRPVPCSRGGVPGPARALGVAMAGLVLLGACSPATEPPSADPAPSRMPGAGAPTPGSGGAPAAKCPESGVRISSPGSDAAMGLRALGLELVNCGTEPYPLNGYPALRLHDGDGNPIPVRVVNGAKEITPGFDAPPRPLTLRPGERAGAAVLWRNLVTDPTVVATNGERLEVAPAAGRPAQVVDLDGPIDLGNTGRIGVSAWKKMATAPAPTRPLPDTSAPSSSVPLP